MTRGQLITNIRANLNDAGVSFYTATDLTDSLQDGYDDVAAQSKCIVKSSTINWQNGLSYYDFISLSVSDYLGCTAIFNNNNNLWLEDFYTRFQVDNEDPHWEITEGEPRLWIPINFKYIAVYPRKTTATGNFSLKYWAKAPTMTLDSDIPLIATDKHELMEFYTTADLLEQGEEYSKAATYWQEYENSLSDYIERVQNISRADLLLIV